VAAISGHQVGAAYELLLLRLLVAARVTIRHAGTRHGHTQGVGLRLLVMPPRSITAAAAASLALLLLLLLLLLL
jgi:hypothetical protein